MYDELAAQAGRAVNLSLTLCNLLIGYYITEYELCGLDRFYRLYPEIVGTMSAQLKKLLPAGWQAVGKVGTASPQLRNTNDLRDKQKNPRQIRQILNSTAIGGEKIAKENQ
ncbi:MAG: hypothetical protein U9Q84_03990 [Thermodesulfobacteriota bacterium]|nr:hypothetical protein [Thermodesulfobacteriota bacterium]